MRLSLLLCLFASLSFAAPPKKKKAAVPPKPAANLVMEAAIKKTLDGAEEQVGACVLDNNGPGGWTLVVKAALTINSAGQLMGSTLTLKPEGPAAEKLKKCIDDVLQGLTYPKSPAPLVNAEREWTFSTENGG